MTSLFARTNLHEARLQMFANTSWDLVVHLLNPAVDALHGFLVQRYSLVLWNWKEIKTIFIFMRKMNTDKELGGRNRNRTAVYLTSGISKSFLVKNSTRPVATAAGFLPGKSWLAHGIDTVSISGIHCCSRSATSKNTGNVSLPRIDSTGCRISFRSSVVIFQRCMVRLERTCRYRIPRGRTHPQA